MKEIWKDITGYENIYQVSNKGMVKSLKRYYIKKDKVLTKSLMYGYHSVHLRTNGESTPKVHRLVAEAFIPNPENKPQINHKDGNKLNNHVDNLEWCTAKENSDHAIETGLKNPVGESNGNSNKTEEIVLEIREKYTSGNYTQKQLAVEYNSNQSEISRIVLRKTWKHI